MSVAESGLTRIEAQARAALITVRSYDVELDLGAARTSTTFRSRTTITFDCHTPGAATFVDVTAVLREATLNGTPLGEPTGTRLALSGLATENVLVVDGDFTYSDSGEGLHRFTDPADGEVYLWSMTFLAEGKRVFACFDQPDLKAPFTLHVTAPPDWKVVTSGPQASTEGDITHFAPTKPLSTYVVAVMAGPYHEVTRTYEDPDGPIPMGLYCRRSLAPFMDDDEIFAVTFAGFDFFQKEFGYPYPFTKFDQIFAPDFYADGMENAAAVGYTDNYMYQSKVTEAQRQDRAYTILHEISHMWFGDLVTTRWWDGTWLNESFATFAGLLAQAEATRWDTAWAVFAQQVKSEAYQLDQKPTTHPIDADIPDEQAALVNFDEITYAKGASVLKQLVAYVGRDAFMTALQGYFRAHAYGTTTLGDLLAALEAAGGRDMAAWSAQWLETAQVNTVHAEFETDADGRFTAFAVVQEAVAEHPTLRDHRLAIGLYTGSGGRLERTHRVEVDVAGARTEIPQLHGLAQPDLVLVNDDDLTYAKIRFDPRSLQTVLRRIADLPDALARALCWTAAWDMTRDGELPAHDYIELVLGAIDAETEPSVFDALLDNLAEAVERFTAPERLGAARERLTTAAWAAVERAEPGSGRQLEWARVLARATGGSDRLRALHDGTVIVAGLDLDLDLRWTTLQGLVAHGAADATDIAAELARDPNSTAELHATTATALLPTAAAKEQAWELATGAGDAHTAATRRAAGNGFWRPAQAELVAPFEARFFAELTDLWARHDGNLLAKHMSDTLFPRIVSAEVLAAADTWLARSDVHPAQHRLVLEHRDELARALRNREVDAR